MGDKQGGKRSSDRASREAALIAAARRELAVRQQVTPARDLNAAQPATAAASLLSPADPDAVAQPGEAVLEPRPALNPDQAARRVELLMLAEAQARRQMKRRRQIWCIYVPAAVITALGLWGIVAMWRVI